MLSRLQGSHGIAIPLRTPPVGSCTIMSLATRRRTNVRQYRQRTPAVPTKAKAYWVIYFYEY